MRASLAAPAPLGWPILAGARATIFRHFCAGETLNDVRVVADRLSASGVRCIIDHSTEESEEPSARQRNLESKLILLDKLQRELSGACAFVPVKLTAIASPSLLERISLSATDRSAASSKGGDFDVNIDTKPSTALDQVAARLEAADRDDLMSSLDSLRKMCIGAQVARIPLLLDAEQSPRQPGLPLASSFYPPTTLFSLDHIASSAPLFDLPRLLV